MAKPAVHSAVIAGQEGLQGSSGARQKADNAILEQRLGQWKRIAFSSFFNFSDIQPDDAEDMFQELSASYWAQQDRITNPEAWFFACARKMAHRFVTRRNPQTDSLDVLATRSASSPDPETWAVQQVFFSLSEHCRKLLGCLIVEEWTVAKLVAATHRKPRDLISQGSRCLKSLQTRWRKASSMGNKTADESS